jgi:adenosyl cobinamide kinase/adenosyl cobinamide phosphate guanylyltransferase
VSALVLGGNSSGKSEFAESLLRNFNNVSFVATGMPTDDEMKERIAKHRSRRPRSWSVLECGAALVEALRGLSTQRPEAVLVDSIGGWVVGTLDGGTRRFELELQALLSVLQELSDAGCSLALVCELSGMGGVPANELQRRFDDRVGIAAQALAGICEQVWLVVAGIPTQLKFSPPKA